MYISNMKLENFRCFPGTTSFDFCKGINYFVGNNNCGKTTVLKAVDFLLSANSKEEWINIANKNKEVSVEITLKDKNFANILSGENLKKYNKYIDNKAITLRRSSEETTWTDSKNKEKKLTIKNIGIYNPISKVFENPTGVDKMIGVLFDAQFVYSDLDNDDYQDFHKTKIVGKLISSYTKSFQKGQIWKNFESAHQKAFGKNGLKKQLIPLEQKLENIMSAQYGTTGVSFYFDIPNMDYFFNVGKILLDDNGILTPASEKGTGMQRALALSLIQVYAQVNHSDDEKPIIFFIDEPETFLHPQAQDKLLSALNKLSEQSQIFITTHSPYLLKHFNSKKDKLIILSRQNNIPQIKLGVNLNLFPNSPTWGEINFLAFNIGSEDFHIELFGYLHSEAINVVKTYQDKNNNICKIEKSIKSFDGWLASQKGCKLTDNNHYNHYSKYTDKSMTCYIRNWIDHPGEPNDLPKGKHRKKPTSEEIKESIDFMISLIKKEEEKEKEKEKEKLSK